LRAKYHIEGKNLSVDKILEVIQSDKQ